MPARELTSVTRSRTRARRFSMSPATRKNSASPSSGEPVLDIAPSKIVDLMINKQTQYIVGRLYRGSICRRGVRIEYKPVARYGLGRSCWRVDIQSRAPRICAAMCKSG